MNLTQMGLFLTEDLAEIEKLEIPTSSKEVGEQLKLMDSILSKFIDWAIGFARVLVVAVLIYVIGKKIIEWVLKLLGKGFQRTNMDEGVSKFILSLVKACLYGILFICVVGKLGIPTSSFIALIGSAGVTIGLALQGSLANFAGGVLILMLKPFRVGDYIIAGSLEGVVNSIDIFYTKLVTADNRLIVIPNGTLSNSNLVNVTQEPVRRLDLLLDVDYATDLKQAKEVLSVVASENEKVLKEEHEITVFVNSLEASSVQLGLRVWVNTDEYWSLKWELLEDIKNAFDRENISIPFNQLDVNIVKNANI